MITPGAKPDLDFTVHILRDGKKTPVRFADLLDGPSVVSVYMRNNTPACDLQTADLVRHAKAIGAAGLRVIAVSRDTCSSHAKYAEKIGATFTLVSDPDDLFAKAVDSMVEKSMYGKKYTGPARAAYLFDSAKKISAVIPKVAPDEHARQILDAAKPA